MFMCCGLIQSLCHFKGLLILCFCFLFKSQFCFKLKYTSKCLLLPMLSTHRALLCFINRCAEVR